MPKRLKRTILYGGYLILVTLLLLEIGVRLWGYSERYIYDPVYTSFEPSEDIPYIHKPNLVRARGRGLAVINTDSLGLRSLTSGTVYGTKQSSEYRIAIAGDSFTFGEGIPNTKDTFSQVLENRLNQQQSHLTVKVFNFGVSAYSVKQMATTLEHRMLVVQPDLVVMAIFTIDLNLDRTPIIDKEGYLIPQKVSFLPFHATITKALRKLHLSYLVRDIALPWFSQTGHLNPHHSGSEIPDSYRYIQNFKDTAERFELPYVIVLLSREEKKVWGPLPDRLTQDGITYFVLSELGKGFTEDEYFASPFDRHASAAVHRRIAELLAEYVRHLPAFSLDLPPSN